MKKSKEEIRFEKFISIFWVLFPIGYLTVIGLSIVFLILWRFQ